MNAFQKTAIATLIAILVLIGVGSLVRVSGAGLGCPDWPKCWGSWFPPSSVDEIDKRYLAERGLDIADFNAVKMWIEYGNRLVGVLIGVLVIATFLRAIPHRQTNPAIFYGSLMAVLLVGFEGWLGGQVVKSGLKPGVITLHMAGAMVLLCALLYVALRAVDIPLPDALPVPKVLARLSGVLFAAICIQMLLGTQVREAIDPYIKNSGGVSRSAWIANVGLFDHIHRSFTWGVVAIAAYLAHIVRKIGGVLKMTCYLALALIISQAGSGIALAYGGLPRVFQVLHLVNSAMLICAAYALWFMLKTTTRNIGRSR